MCWHQASRVPVSAACLVGPDSNTTFFLLCAAALNGSKSFSGALRQGNRSGRMRPSTDKAIEEEEVSGWLCVLH
jgi:hypothetical protein